MSLTKLENELLKTLSFYEPMSLELIYLDLDQDFLLHNSELTLEDLNQSLSSLVKEKKIKQLNKETQIMWIRVFPKKSFFKRITQKLSKYLIS